MKCRSVLLLLLAVAAAGKVSGQTVSLVDSTCDLVWTQSSNGWALTQTGVKTATQETTFGTPSGPYCYLIPGKYILDAHG